MFNYGWRLKHYWLGADEMAIVPWQVNYIQGYLVESIEILAHFLYRASRTLTAHFSVFLIVDFQIWMTTMDWLWIIWKAIFTMIILKVFLESEIQILWILLFMISFIPYKLYAYSEILSVVDNKVRSSNAISYWVMVSLFIFGKSTIFAIWMEVKTLFYVVWAS